MQEQTPTPPAAPTAPAIAGGVQLRSDPSGVLQAYREQRGELRDQLERLENQRDNLTEQLQSAPDGAAKAGLQARIASIDARIATVDKALADADASVARAAAVPGAVIPPPPEPVRNGPPEEFFILLMVMVFFIGMPIAIAYARRIWKKGVTTVSAIPDEIYERFNRIDQAIDSVAVEVERIGEGQRFVTRMVNDRALGAGPAEPVKAESRGRAEERR